MKTIQDVPQDSRYPLPIFKVGDGATYRMYSDAKAGTIIEVSKSGKQVVMQKDKATLDPNFKPDIVPGGFSGHCVNQNDQTYTYEADPEGSTIKFTVRKWRGRYVWTVAGTTPDGRMQLGEGRNEFYDYNF